jgi:hypothetical protein
MNRKQKSSVNAVGDKMAACSVKQLARLDAGIRLNGCETLPIPGMTRILSNGSRDFSHSESRMRAHFVMSDDRYAGQQR